MFVSFRIVSFGCRLPIVDIKGDFKLNLRLYKELKIHYTKQQVMVAVKGNKEIKATERSDMLGKISKVYGA